SRDESLISFCNRSFYDGRLLTIPSARRPEPGRALRIQDPSLTDDGARALLERPISFHRLEGGLYAKRRNAPEATYLAGMVRSLLAAETGKTIGIVAFSEAQQQEIEEVLETLAAADPAFRIRLDAERDREEHGQFVGLFVKNLENVQGDE